MIFNHKKLIYPLYALAWTILLSNNISAGLTEQRSLNELREDVNSLQEILFAASPTQFAVTVAVDVVNRFTLDSLSFEIDDKAIKTYLYTKRENDALVRNAIQNIYVGDIKAGQHTISASFSAVDENAQNIKISAKSKFVKTDKTTFIELKISKSAQQDVPVFNITIWE